MESTTQSTTTSKLDQELSDKRVRFLKDFQNGQSKQWTIVMGNEAGDLDSLASSIGYSYFASSSLFIPLQLTPRTDLYLRPENLESLSQSKISLSSLLTIDDLEGKQAQLESNYVLVDHNSLLPSFRSSSSQEEDRVVSIIDHHVDERQHLSASPRLINLVGSCSSLITTHFFQQQQPELEPPKELADLLIKTVLIDTRLKPVEKNGKATPIDLKAVSLLLPFSSFPRTTTTTTTTTNIGEGKEEEVGVFDKVGQDTLSSLKETGEFLIKLKEEVSWMNGRDLLRRDYKEYTTEVEGSLKYGLSTVPLGLNVWLDKFEKEDSDKRLSEGVLKDIRNWMKERELKLCGVLTSYNHLKKNGEFGKHRRELLILTNELKFDKVFEGLELDQVLQLEEWKLVDQYGGVDRGGERQGGESYERWKVWQQGNTKATRKQVAPVLKDLINQALSLK
ncbi:hypothetical protein JCM3765_005122 [Sporobolomyces pararoseus]